MQIAGALRKELHLKPAEMFIAIIGVAVCLIDVVLILQKGSKLDLPAYAGIAAIVLTMLPIGLFYRVTGRSERIASAMICTANFIFLSACLSLFNYLLLPITRPLIDLQIAEIDALLGYHWPDIMQLAAANPIPTFVLKLAYMTTMPQFAMLVVILGLTGRHRDLHVMITSVTITATLTICFWGLFPTLGAKSMHVLPPELWSAVNPIVDAAYTRELILISTYGPQMISPNEIRGLVAFPSYHAVLAFTAIYAARNVPILAPAFMVLNLLILPGIFVHGGHHLLDLPAGFIMFVLGTWLATRAVKPAVDTAPRLAS